MMHENSLAIQFFYILCSKGISSKIPEPLGSTYELVSIEHTKQKVIIMQFLLAISTNLKLPICKLKG